MAEGERRQAADTDPLREFLSFAVAITPPPPAGRSLPNAIARNFPAGGRATGAYFKARDPGFKLVDAPPTLKRRPISRVSRQSWRGLVHCWKSERSLDAHGALQIELFEQLQVDPALTCPFPHPAKLAIMLDSRWQTYVPPLFVLRGEQPYFLGVAWESGAKTTEGDRKWEAIGRGFSGLGFGFELLTERHLRAQPRIKTVGEVLAGRMADPPNGDDVDLVRAAVAAHQLTLEAVLLRFPRLTRAQVLLLVLRDVLRVDLDLPLQTQRLQLGGQTQIASGR